MVHDPVPPEPTAVAAIVTVEAGAQTTCAGPAAAATGAMSMVETTDVLVALTQPVTVFLVSAK